jgi:hypothetical protein
MYRLELQVARPLYLTVHHDDEAWRWHERLGHANFGSVEKISKLEMVRELSTISHVDQFYDMCVLAKHRRGTFPKQSKYHADKALELVHDDLCGPVKPATPGRRCYFLLLVDDAACYMWVVLLAAKLRGRRTDNGGEFTTVEFATYCADDRVM